MGTGFDGSFFHRRGRPKDEGGGTRIAGVPTSSRRASCATNGIPLRDAQDCRAIDLAVDGADEVDPTINVTKGGGGGPNEKLVPAWPASCGDRGREQLVSRLGSTAAITHRKVTVGIGLRHREVVTRLGAQPRLGWAVNKDGPLGADNGQLVIDAKFGQTSTFASDARCTDTPGVRRDRAILR